MFTSFLPAVSKDALPKMSAEVRSWRVHLRTGRIVGSRAQEINPVVRGSSLTGNNHHLEGINELPRQLGCGGCG